MEIQHLCINCFEGITNPVCEKCFLKQIEYWLIDRKVGSESRKIIIKNIKNQMPKGETLNEIECIICGKENVSLCSYCFFLKVVKVLKTLHFKEDAMENFLEIFNYSLGHEEYNLL